MLKRVLALSGLTMVLASCGSSSDGPSGIVTTKTLLSSWTVQPTNQWVAELDGAGANHSGTPFTLSFVFTDNSVTTCTATLNGSDTTGTYSVTICNTDPGGLSQATGTGPFLTGGVGSYATDGALLSLCKANTTCLEYN